jgi:nucleoid-associated protein Lsr2
MARDVVVRITDDFDGTEAVETVTFAFRGVDYEIDVNQENLDAMEQAFETWIEHGRKADTRHRTGRRGHNSSLVTHADGATRARPGAGDLAAMRSWARANGYRVSDRGRVSTEVRAAFRAAHD